MELYMEFYFTEFDFVDKGNFSLLMSLPQMKNFEFQFEFSPGKTYMLYKCHGETGFENNQKPSFHSGLASSCMVHELSVFQPARSQFFFPKHYRHEYNQLFVQRISI